MSKTSPPSASYNLWILGPKRDSLLFILTPLLIIPLGLALNGIIPLGILSLYVLGLGGFGHHLPGFIRAYSDPDLFRRFKLRFTVVPALILAACGLYAYLNLNALVAATVLWGTWHGAMQINGFLRIYDAKVKSFQPITARLDYLMCLAWFGGAILHSPAKLFSLVTQFYLSGGALIPPAAFNIFRSVWDAATVLITLMFVANARRQWKAGMPPNPVKLANMAVSFAFWWYCIVWLNNFVLGILMWEIFHDVQYNVLVWLFQRQRVEKDFHVGRLEKFLFGRGPARMAFYACLVLGYGYIGVVSSYGDVNLPEKALMGSGLSQWLLRITLASALLHFYFDGFIWKIRDRSIRRGLGLQEGTDTISDGRSPDAKLSESKVSLSDARGGSRHGWAWALFSIPVICLGVAQYRGAGTDFNAMVVNLADAIPGSWIANFLSGTFHKGQGRIEEAEGYYRRTVEYNPGFAMGHLFLGDILYRRGNFPEALEQYRISVVLDSTSLEGRMNLAFLYLKAGQPLSAVEHFQAALALDPENVRLSFGLASAFMQQNRLPEAETYLERTLQLSPNHSGALNYSGVIHEVNGDFPGAIEFYRRALAADTSNTAARGNLATALSKAQPTAH